MTVMVGIIYGVAHFFTLKNLGSSRESQTVLCLTRLVSHRLFAVFFLIVVKVCDSLCIL